MLKEKECYLLFSGKLWGQASSQPVLMLHGLQDNCGSFDKLISMLAGDYLILAIDFPGHGLSSHFPTGLPTDLLNFVVATKFVIDEIKWRRFLIMGHSLGGLVAMHFSSCFPELIEKLINIDSIFPRPFVNDEELLYPIRMWMENVMNLERLLQKRRQPVYTYEEALKKLVRRDSSLTEDAGTILTKRSLEKTEDGFVFRMDQRLKIDLFPSATTASMIDTLEHLRFPVLFIFSTERHVPYKNLFKDIYAVMAKKPNFKIEVVEGTHEVVQNDPEKLVKLIDEFFMKNSKL